MSLSEVTYNQRCSVRRGGIAPRSPRDADVVTIGATRISSYAAWFYAGSNNDYLVEFAENMIQHGLGAGDALFEYKANNAPGLVGRWKNALCYGVYGCPAVGLLPFNFAGPVFSF